MLGWKTGRVLFAQACAVLVLGLFLSRPCVASDVEISTPPFHELISKAYGVQDANRMTALRYVFQVTMEGTHVRREWEWDVVSNTVTYHGPGPNGAMIQLTYNRNRMADGNAVLNKQVDEWFVHDQYWLLFPFHLAWDAHVRFRDMGEASMPLSYEPGHWLRVLCPDVNGRLGDRYDLFVGANHLIQEWIWRDKNGALPPTAMKWDSYARAGPFLFSLNRIDPKSHLRVWYDDVAVRLENDNRWIPALPVTPSLAKVQ